MYSDGCLSGCEHGMASKTGSLAWTMSFPAICNGTTIVCWGYIGGSIGLYWDNGKEHRNYSSMFGLYWCSARVRRFIQFSQTRQIFFFLLCNAAFSLQGGECDLEFEGDQTSDEDPLRDNGKENGNYYWTIGAILGLYWDNGGSPAIWDLLRPEFVES